MLPFPSSMPASVVPPIANIEPIPINIPSSGKNKVMADSPSAPTNCPINIESIKVAVV